MGRSFVEKRVHESVKAIIHRIVYRKRGRFDMGIKLLQREGDGGRERRTVRKKQARLFASRMYKYPQNLASIYLDNRNPVQALIVPVSETAFTSHLGGNTISRRGFCNQRQSLKEGSDCFCFIRFYEIFFTCR